MRTVVPPTRERDFLLKALRRVAADPAAWADVLTAGPFRDDVLHSSKEPPRWLLAVTTPDGAAGPFGDAPTLVVAVGPRPPAPSADGNVVGVLHLTPQAEVETAAAEVDRLLPKVAPPPPTDGWGWWMVPLVVALAVGILWRSGSRRRWVGAAVVMATLFAPPPARGEVGQSPAEVYEEVRTRLRSGDWSGAVTAAEAAVPRDGATTFPRYHLPRLALAHALALRGRFDSRPNASPVADLGRAAAVLRQVLDAAPPAALAAVARHNLAVVKAWRSEALKHAVPTPSSRPGGAGERQEASDGGEGVGERRPSEGAGADARQNPFDDAAGGGAGVRSAAARPSPDPGLLTAGQAERLLDGFGTRARRQRYAGWEQ